MLVLEGDKHLVQPLMLTEFGGVALATSGPIQAVAADVDR